MDHLWIGRFAPTPSGPLHFGSLVAALASFLIAKQRGGQWLLRIEDLDPPREVSGAASDILHTLEAFGFVWDGEVVYQSQRQSLYQQTLEMLIEQGLIYRCACSRNQLQQRNAGIYDGYCRSQQIDHSKSYALRIKFDRDFSQFDDKILARCCFTEAIDRQDFVVRRRDGLFAYQLAVVTDDIHQGVNHVVRGADILDSTPRQNFLYDCLNKPSPEYYHLPLVLDQYGAKLSKRKFSAAVSAQNASHWLVESLRHLGQKVATDLSHHSPRQILQWALENWDVERVGSKPIIYQD